MGAKHLTRKNYKEHRSLKSNKTLKQLVLLSLKSSQKEGLYFNQIKESLKKSINLNVSNYILKLTLQQLLASKHVEKSNKVYKLSGKKFNRKKKVTKSKLSRKTRKRVLKQAKHTRSAMKATVGAIIQRKYQVLEKVIMKAMRKLKRDADKNKTRKGFVFNQIKAEVKRISKGKKIRNVVLIKALENLRSEGKVLLRKGRNYLPKNHKKTVNKKKPVKRNKPKKTKRKSSKKVFKKKKSPVKNEVMVTRGMVQKKSVKVLDPRKSLAPALVADLIKEAQQESIKELKETSTSSSSSSE